jgi:hypothetical protein
MPLKQGTGKNAFASNIKAEIAAGKPKEQAVAIAYATKRKAASPPAPAPVKPMQTHGKTVIRGKTSLIKPVVPNKR